VAGEALRRPPARRPAVARRHPLHGGWDRHSDICTSSRSSGGSSNRSSCCRTAVFAPMDSPAGDQLNEAGTAAQTRAALTEANRLSQSGTQHVRASERAAALQTARRRM
jgi:hypothetical protein